MMSQQPGTPCHPVKEVRQALGISQDELAHELGCSQANIYRWEQKGSLRSEPYVLAKLVFLAKLARIAIEL